jgi:hypothetical protein
MFEAIHRWLSKRRLDKIYTDERFIDEIPSINIGWEGRAYFDLSQDGERTAFIMPSMQFVAPDSIHVNPDSVGWTERSKPYNTYHLEAAEKIANFLKLRKAQLWYGVPFCRVDSVTYYLNSDSIRPNYVVLYTSWTKEVRVPKAAFSNLLHDKMLKPDIYTMHPIDLSTRRKADDWKPIIEMLPGTQGVNSAYTALTDVPGCPGVLDFLCNDIVININCLDNSALPIVDLEHFIAAIRDGFPHVSNRWTLNIEQIQLQIGMNPKPIRVIDLASELKDHRIILSETPMIQDCEEYKNTGNLSTTYP